MHIKPSPFRLAPLAVASMVLIWSAGAAHAAPVLGALTTASVNSIAAPTTGPGTDPSWVTSSSFIANTLGRGIGYAFAANFGAYTVSSSATGIATGTAKASFDNTFTNTSGVEQFYTLNFFIYGGSISTTVFAPAGLSDGEFLKAGYGASIKFNGNTVFSSAAELLRDDDNNTPPLTTSGTALNGGTLSVSGDTYFWDSATYSVSLGLVAAGATFNILAEVLDYAEADVGVYNFTGGGGYGGCGSGYGDLPSEGQPAAALPGVDCFKGAARAFYGDPLDVNASPPPGQFQLIPSVVPEPGSLGLVAGALGAGLLAMRRRRRDGPDQG